MTEGLKGEWERDYPSWAQASRQIFEEIESVPVRILVWGPGVHSIHYQKRIAIRDHIRSQSKYNEVVTSEELIENMPEFTELNPQDAEQLQLDMCDAVILLLVKDHHVTGVQTEASLFRGDPSFELKARLIIPKMSPEERKIAIEQGSFLSQGWLDFPRELCFEYNEAEYEDCTQIRHYCSQFAARIRLKKAFRIRQAKKYAWT